MQDGQPTATTDVTDNSSLSTANNTSQDSDTSDFVSDFFGDNHEADKNDEVPPTEKGGDEVEEKDEQKTNNEENEDEVKDESKQEFPKAEARKQELNEEIRSLSGDVRTLQAQKESLAKEVSQYQGIQDARQNIENSRVTAEQLERAGLDPQDAQVQAFLYNQELDKQASEVAEIENSIADLQINLNVDRLEVIRDFPVFDDRSPEFDEEFTEFAMKSYAQAADLQLDSNGRPVSSNLKLYSYMKDLADMRNHIMSAGQRRGQQNQARQDANVFNPGGGQAVSDGDDTSSFVNNFFK